MGEPFTPLWGSTGVARLLGGAKLSFKLESCHPSGSYKDRFISAEIAHLMRRGVRACVATSSGNTGASLAAACARYGLGCAIVVNPAAPPGKLVQMQAHGAHVVCVPGFTVSPGITDAVFAQLRAFAASSPAALVVSAYRYCPDGMAGVESIALELAAQTDSLAHVFVPAGGGGLYSAVVRGFRRTSLRARVHLVQPEGCPTMLNAWRSGSAEVHPVTATTTISGLSVPFDIDASLAVSLLRESGGTAIGVTDDEVYAAQDLLLRAEGIYAEPAGATALAGYLAAVRAGTVPPAEPAVCIVTGHGFKDPDAVGRAASRTPLVTIAPDGVLAALPGILEVACPA